MFNPGDVVRLKHSTYKMTVRRKLNFFVGDDFDEYTCVWFDKNQILNEANFSEIMLADASVKDFNLGHNVQEE